MYLPLVSGEKIPSMAMENSPPDSDLLVIRPESAWWRIDFVEIWHFRELLYFLVWRNIKVRYKQTIMGFMWAVIQPLVTTGVFVVVFGKMAKIPTDGVPKALFYYAGLVPWIYFSGALQMASSSLVSDANLVRKVYFPRLFLPTTACLTGWVDFLISWALLFCMMPFFPLEGSARFALGIGLVLVPVLLFLATLTALSVAFWLSALGIQFHDVRYAVPFLVQTWLFISPVVYPASMVPEPFIWVYGLNPMATVITAFRWSMGLGPFPDLIMVISSCGMLLVLFVLGLRYFRKTERIFADVL